MARYEDSSETILVALAQNGDREALEELLRHAYRLLRAYVTSLTNSADVDDLLQEIACASFSTFATCVIRPRFARGYFKSLLDMSFAI